jgi:hypothetical protein
MTRTCNLRASLWGRQCCLQPAFQPAPPPNVGQIGNLPARKAPTAPNLHGHPAKGGAGFSLWTRLKVARSIQIQPPNVGQIGNLPARTIR